MWTGSKSSLHSVLWRGGQQEELEEVCTPIGEVHEIRLLKDVTTGQNRGYAFVGFKSPEAAQEAIKTLNGRFPHYLVP